MNGVGVILVVVLKLLHYCFVPNIHFLGHKVKDWPTQNATQDVHHAVTKADEGLG